jgi:putative ABC transport system substrate-binding protein
VDHRWDAGAGRRLLSRRDLMSSLYGAALGCPIAAWAQSPVARVAVLDPAAVSGWQACVDALRERGWVDGRNLAFELRSTEGRLERFQELATELVALRPDVIIAVSSQSTQALRERTGSIPIVMVGVADPIGSGFVASLARPGRNITGVSNQFRDTAGKMLQLLTELRPGISRVPLFFVPDNSGSRLN